MIVTSGAVHIHGERRMKESRRVWGYSYKVEGFGTYFESLTLPSYVSPEGGKASFDRGVLTVKFPKHPSSRARVIPVDAKGKEILPGSRSGTEIGTWMREKLNTLIRWWRRVRG